jgi:hypothetical protein
MLSVIHRNAAGLVVRDTFTTADLARLEVDPLGPLVVLRDAQGGPVTSFAARNVVRVVDAQGLPLTQ